MRICQIIGLIFALVFLGCKEKVAQTVTVPAEPVVVPPPPKPTIKVQLNEIGQATISFSDEHLKRRDAGRYYDHYAEIDLRNLEDLRAYKKQLDFLSKQFEEAEKQMEIHELPVSDEKNQP